MSKTRGVIAAVFFFFFATLMTTAFAAEEKIDLKGRLWENVKGTATVSDAGEGKKQITIEASNLKPDSTYTAWFVNEKAGKDMSGVGTGDYSFKSDSKGNAKYTAVVSSDVIENWDSLEIDYHPDNNPKNMENISTALKGDLGEAETAALPKESRPDSSESRPEASPAPETGRGGSMGGGMSRGGY